MRFPKRILITVAATLATVVSASAAMAQSYSGNWPLNVTHSQHSNGTHCLTLTDNGSERWPHSGQASLTFVSGTLLGSFQLIDNLLVATIDQPAVGASAELVFTGPASLGRIGNGTYEQVYGGEFDSGVLAFGRKGGC